MNIDLCDIKITDISLGKNKKKLQVDIVDVQKQEKMIIKTQNTDVNDHNIVKISGNLLHFEGTSLSVIYENGKPWFRCKDVGNILEYKNTTEAIRYNIDKDEIRKYSSFNQENFLPLKGNAKNALYVSKIGLNNLILESKAKGAKKFKKWIAVLLDKIDNGEEIYENDNKPTKNYFIEPCLEYKDWALTHTTIDFKGENIFYIGVIGKFTEIRPELNTNVNNGEVVFKYGFSDDEWRREKEHKAEYDNFTCFYIKKCSKFNRLEKDFEKELTRKGLIRHLKFDNKKTTDQELFVLCDNFNMNDVMSFVENWIDKYDVKFDELEIEKEKTKQEQFKVLQKEKDIELKKIELEILKIQFEQKK